jgi:hypothetical protein
LRTSAPDPIDGILTFEAVTPLPSISKHKMILEAYHAIFENTAELFDIVPDGGMDAFEKAERAVAFNRKLVQQGIVLLDANLKETWEDLMSSREKKFQAGTLRLF